MTTKSPLRICLLTAVVWLSTAPAFGQTQAEPEITLRVSPAELKIIAHAMATHPAPQTVALVVKLQAQVDTQFPPGPYATELPLPAISGRDR